jgi:tRNA nucleotidyltransferase (CCA-adding enzyme)
LEKSRHAKGSRIGVQRPEFAKTLFPETDAFLAKLPGQAEIFCVGGAVRDLLLGSPSADRDYVVVGASIDDMMRAGFTPVGKDFPVFLHPTSHDEYALARTERKSGKGYKGFVFLADPSVTLQEDLARRDLTINAIAINRLGEIIDPFNGMQDLENKTLRHISKAFSEDPVRLLRLARFLARWPEFSVADETLALCERIVAEGEADALVPERVWQEMQTGLMESSPSRMIELLQACGAWQAITQTGTAIHASTLDRLKQAVGYRLPLEARFGLLMHNLGGTPIDPRRFKAPRACLEFADFLCRASQDMPKDFSDAQGLLHWLFLTDFQRRPERFSTLLDCMAIEARLGPSDIRLLKELEALFNEPQNIERIAAAAKQAESEKDNVRQAVEQARLSVLESHPHLSQRG